MILRDLITGLPFQDIQGALDLEVSGIVFDSRQVREGSLFVAVKGTVVDGHDYIEKAIDSGAVAVVAEHLNVEVSGKVTVIQVQDSALLLGLLASRWYGNPSEQLQLVGVTGTNGKTTCATLLYQLFTALGHNCGLLSTVEYRIGNEVVPSTHTTPDPVSIHRLLARMVEQGCKYAFMEVSSHAVVQRRIAGLHFRGGIFTNITHDHLDYHGTFQNYLKAKKQFFDELPATAFALVNLDDRNGTVMVQNTRAQVNKYSLRTLTDFKGKVLDNSLEGLHLNFDGQEFHARVMGDFNAWNLLAVYGAGMLLGVPQQELLVALSQLPGAEGRFETVRHPKLPIIGVVDYAHTPDALEKILDTIRQLRKQQERVVTVVGCGGDRDKTKRPLMAKIAVEKSHQVVLTSDNPRSEDPETILAEMQAGIPDQTGAKVLSIVNRKEAIKTAVALAQSGDIILVAGKGHEKYQEIKGVKYPFDDVAELKAAFGIVEA
jgi:UDP-N-acetylmuramoyl-L-alanyl-D-glutamate--2,6-diaminopimelate ligase